MLNIGDQVTVVGKIDGQPRHCVVTEILIVSFRSKAEPRWANDNNCYFTRDFEEEGTCWAHGWATPDALALCSLAALENCSQ